MTDLNLRVNTVQAPAVHYIPVPVREETNFIEGLMWGANGIHNAIAGVALTAGVVLMDAGALGTIASNVLRPNEVVAGAVVLAAANVLAYYVAKAEFSIASKSFTHMANTIL